MFDWIVAGNNGEQYMVEERLGDGGGGGGLNCIGRRRGCMNVKSSFLKVL